jgi:hypothetical protein
MVLAGSRARSRSPVGTPFDQVATVVTSPDESIRRSRRVAADCPWASSTNSEPVVPSNAMPMTL